MTPRSEVWEKFHLFFNPSLSMTQVPGSQGERDMVAAVRLDTRECLQVGNSLLKLFLFKLFFYFEPLSYWIVQPVDNIFHFQDSKVRYFHHNLLEPGQHGQDEDDDGLKQRGAERHQEKERSPERDQTSSEPLKWFGLLTPPALRQSQASFRTAVEVSVECANIQSEMTGVTNRIKFIQRRLKSTTTKQNVEELDASFSSSLKI